MTQESRLVISVDSRKAKPSVDELSAAMRALETAGVRVTKANTDVGSSMDRMAAQSNAAANSLKRGLVAVLGGMSAMRVIDIADEWGQYASRIKMATESTEEYQRVQSRMLESANATYRNINETREAFIQLSPVLRQMGMSLDQSMDAIDTFSGLLVTNAASADRGAAAMRALSVAFQKGKVDADQWITIYSTVDSIVDLIAKSSGKSAEEIRKLGATGKLSVQMLSQALMEGYLPTMQKVEEMPTTVRDALQNINNAFSEYIGWNNETNGATAKLAEGIQMLGDNFAVVANTGLVLAGGALAVYATRLGISTAATIAQGVASTRTAMQQAALAASFNGTSTAAARATVAMRALNLAMGPAGWVGLAATAAAGMYMFSDNADKAAKSAVSLTTPLDDLVKKFKELDEAQQRTMLSGSELQIETEIKKVDSALKELITGSLADGTKAVAQWRADVGQQIGAAAQAAIDGSMSFRDLSSYLVALATSYGEAKGRSKEWVDQTIALAGSLSEAGLTVEQLRERVRLLRDQIADLNNTTGSVNVAQGMDDSVTAFLEKAQKQILSLQASKSSLAEAQQIIFANPDLPKEQAEAMLLAAKAVDQYRKMTQEAGKSTKDYVSSVKSLLDTHLPERQALIDLRGNLDLLTKVRNSGKISAEEYDKALQSINLTYANSLESTKQQIEMERVLKELREQQSVTQLQFMRDLASFGQGDRIRELNADLATVEDRYRSLIEARRNSAQGLSDSELAQIKASLDAELQMVREYHDKKLLISQDWALGARDALINYADDAANVYQSMGDMVSSAFKGMEDALTQFVTTGKMDFKSLADSIIQDMVRIAIQQSITGPLAGAFGNMIGGMFSGSALGGTSLSGATWGPKYSLNATASTGFTGIGMLPGRASGGPVEAGKMYEVNEHGIPELLTVGGKQLLMMAGQGGHVTPMSRSAAVPSIPRMSAPAMPQVNVNIQGAPGQPEVTQRRNQDGGFDIDIVFRQIENRIAGGVATGQGKVGKAMEKRYNLTPSLG